METLVKRDKVISNEEKINTLIMTKFSFDDDYANGLIDSIKYQQLINGIDDSIKSLS
jgi:hypothetical protein